MSRGGGGGMSHGGGYVGGGGGYSRGGYGGGYGYRGYGYAGYGYRGYGYGYRGYYGGYYSPYIYAGLGWNYGYWPWYGSYYGYGAYDYPSYSYPAYGYSAYQASPAVNLVYAPSSEQTEPVYAARPNPVIREYDSYGQQVNRAPAGATGGATGAPPIYLIALRDGTIRAAEAYWVERGTLHYVTLQHEQRQASLDSVDRNLSAQLNRERRVAFSLPETQ
jgi:hypothetical protein